MQLLQDSVVLSDLQTNQNLERSYSSYEGKVMRRVDTTENVVTCTNMERSQHRKNQTDRRFYPFFVEDKCLVSDNQKEKKMIDWHNGHAS